MFCSSMVQCFNPNPKSYVQLCSYHFNCKTHCNINNSFLCQVLGGGQICSSMLQARINKMHEIGLDILKILWCKTCGKAQQANPYVDNSFLPIHKYYLFFNKVWICTPIFFYCRWLQIKCQRPKENYRTQKKKNQVCIVPVIAW